MSLNTVVSASVTLCDCIRLVDSAIKTSRDDEHRSLHSISTINKLTILSLSLSGKICKAKNMDSKQISILKSSEIISRCSDFVIRMLEFLRVDAENDTSLLRYYESGIASIMGILYAINESDRIEEESKLKEFEEKGSDAKIPICEYDENSQTNKIVGYEPIDPEECKQNIQALEKYAIVEGILRSVSELGLKRITTLPRSLYEELTLYLKFRETLSAQLDSTSETDKKVIDLLALTHIPDPLHNDIVFRRYICPISQAPIRDPVGDPNGVTLYERSFIISWLRNNPSSPLTRSPLHISQLIEKPALKALIDGRLKFHEERLKDFLENRGRFNLRAPADSALQSNADTENPRT